jgi:HTH-type transcriptional regulator, sugar sensing transcriptional regulator
LTNLNTFELLEKLGLTEYEAKTLNTLFKLKESEAPMISRTAQVPKTRVYDVLEKLIQKNLLIEIKGRPKLYRAIEAEKAINLLISNKKTQLNELEKEAVQLKDNLILYNDNESKGEQVMKVKDKQDFERILGQELGKARKSIHGLTEITDENNIIHEAIKKAQDKKIPIRLLNSIASKKINELAEVRHFNHGLNAFIIDEKKIVLAISDFKKEKPDYHFTIMNEHEPMANALTHYFETHWLKGKKY